MLRFWNNDVLKETEAVMTLIFTALNEAAGAALEALSESGSVQGEELGGGTLWRPATATASAAA